MAGPTFTVEAALVSGPLTTPSEASTLTTTSVGRLVSGSITEAGRAAAGGLDETGRAYVTGASEWVDITAYVRSIEIKRGRDHELGQTQAGELGMRLRNTDRRFDPTNDGGPYWPNVKPMRRVRVRATWQSVAYDLFTGFVENWGQTWPSRPVKEAGDAEVTLEATDAFKLLTLFEIGQTYSAEVLADAPIAYWKLDELAGSTSLADLGSGNNDLTPTGLTLGTFPNTLTGGQYAARWTDGVTGYATNAGVHASHLSSSDRIFEAWVYPTGGPTANCWLLDVDDAGSGSLHRIWYESSVGTINVITWSDPPAFGQGYSISSPGFLTLDTWQHIVVHVRVQGMNAVDLYRNGAFVERCGVSGLGTHAFFTDPAGSLDLVIGNSSGTPLPANNWRGMLSHVAIYVADYPFTDYPIITPERVARIVAHHGVPIDDFPPQLAGQMLHYLLDGMGWPASERMIDTGTTLIQEIAPLGSNLSLMLQIAEDTEQGQLFIDGAGRIVMHERPTSLPAAAAVFGESGSEVPYADLVIRNDDQDLWSRVLVDRGTNRVFTAEDAASREEYGPRTLPSRSTLLALDTQAEDLAAALLARYKDPHERPVQLVLSGGNAEAQTLMLSLELGDRVSIVRRPPPAGSDPITLDARVEGIAHDIVGADAMITTFDLVPVFGYWIVEDDVWGLLEETTVVGW